MKFMSAYAAAPVCTPTRCAYRHGPLSPASRRRPARAAEDHVAGRRRTAAGPSDRRVAAQGQRLRHRAGRQVALGLEAGVRPEPPRVRRVLRHPQRRRRLLHARASDAPGGAPGTGTPDLWENLTPIERVGYLTDLLSDRAVAVHRAAAHEAVLPEPPLHRAARALGRTRGRRDRSHDHGAGPMTEGGSLKIFALDDEEHGRGHRPRAGRARAREAGPQTRWSSSPATTAASATRSTGRSRSRRATCGKAGRACRRSSAGRASCRRAASPSRRRSPWTGRRRSGRRRARRRTRRTRSTARI